MKDYIELIKSNEDWLMKKILFYAEKYEFTKYTSTLEEAWRLSINGLSNSLIFAAKHYSDVIPELHPDEKYIHDPISEFGIIEARKHRQRGTTLGMFLGLMKYYKESYTDLIDFSVKDESKNEFYKKFTNRCFDRIEIAYCLEWTSHGDHKLLNELQDSNRKMTNEKNKYLTIFESSYAPIILLDKNLKISNLNQAAIELFSDFKIAGSIYYNEKSSNSSFKFLNEQILRFIESNPNETKFETYLTTIKGDLLFQVKLKKMQDVSKKFSGTVMMLDDITERTIAEQVIKDNERKLKELNADKDRFITILAHDLRNPFSSLLGFSEIVLKELNNTPITETEHHLEMMHKTIHKTYNLLEDLLLWSKSQSGKLTPILKNIQLNEICRLVVKSVQNQADIKNIKINYIENKEHSVYADLNMLRTVLRNLITNAIKFTNNNGEIKVYTEKDNNYITIIISDNGIGIDQNNLLKIWDFAKPISTNGTADEKGTGFGLVLCKEFVEKNGGKIWVESKLENIPASKAGGCDFKFTLPINKG